MVQNATANETVSMESTDEELLRQGPSPLGGDQATKDYLHFAMHRCVEGAESYANAASVVSFDRQKGFLEALVKAKHRQASELHRFYEGKCYIIDRPIKSRRVSSVTAYLLDVELKPISTLDEAFLFAYKKEREALDMFRGLIETESAEKFRCVFQYLIDQQVEQIRNLERLYLSWKDKDMSECEGSEQCRPQSASS